MPLRPVLPVCVPVPLAAAGAVLAVLALALAAAARAAPMGDQTILPRDVDGPRSAVAGGTLDRTLQVDTGAAQRNVELLLETRDEGDLAQPTPAWRESAAPFATAASAVSQSGGAVPGAPPAVHVDAGGSAGDRAVSRMANVLREYRYWLLGAVGLVAAGGVGGQLWRRQRATAAERRLRELAAQQRPARGGRHRTSRR